MKFAAFDPIDLKNNAIDIEVIKIPLCQIIADCQQPRKNFIQNSLEELALSIKQYGVIQPIIVKKLDNKVYQIIAGERRWRASIIAELKTIPAIIQYHDEKKNFAISLIENIQREELNPIELAKSYYKLSSEHGLSHEFIATMVGKNRVTITNFLRLLNLSDNVQDLLIDSKLEIGHAKALLTLPFEKQEILAQEIVEKKLTVRDTERLVQNSKPLLQEKNNFFTEEINHWERCLSEVFSSKVNVNINEKGKGKIVIHFNTPNEAEWIVNILKNINNPI